MPIEFKKFSVKKSENTDLAKARQKAASKMNTIENNLNVSETETHFVFTKIRG